jgi:hypothetical protein
MKNKNKPAAPGGEAKRNQPENLSSSILLPILRIGHVVLLLEMLDSAALLQRGAAQLTVEFRALVQQPGLRPRCSDACCNILTPTRHVCILVPGTLLIFSKPWMGVGVICTVNLGLVSTSVADPGCLSRIRILPIPDH